MVFCPDCGGPLRIRRMTVALGFGGYSYIDILYCPKCGTDHRPKPENEVEQLPSYIVKNHPLVWDLQSSGDLIVISREGDELEVVVL